MKDFFELIIDNKDLIQTIAISIAAMTPFILAIASFAYYRLYEQRKLQEGDAALIASPSFFSLGSPKVLAVHQYEKSDNDVSGYRHLGQNSRPDQWAKLIEITRSFGFWKVVPKNPDHILTVVVSRNGKEKWRTINFNK